MIAFGVHAPGCPLNIRATPNGRVIGSLRNGTYVRLLDISYDRRGRYWGDILDWYTGRPFGWVFHRFISCY